MLELKARRFTYILFNCPARILFFFLHSPYLQFDFLLPDLDHLHLEIDDDCGEVGFVEFFFTNEGFDKACLPNAGVAHAQDLEQAVVAGERGSSGGVPEQTPCGIICGSGKRREGILILVPCMFIS